MRKKQYMLWKFITPDKPIRTTEGFFDVVDGSWVCEAKLDGFRMEIGKFHGKIHAISRHYKPEPVCEEIRNKMYEIIPEGCSLDCEWINPTRIKAINTQYGTKLPLIEKVMVIDVTWFNGLYLSSMNFKERTSLQIYQNLPSTSMKMEEWPLIFKAIQRPGNLAKSFYLEQMNYQISEGVVVKKLNSKMIGSKRESAKNPSWYKIKYRG
jgi:ATP-dependent DNA ligase